MKQKSQQQMQQAQTLQQAKDDKIKSEGTGYIG
jgi:hypothetical protein